MLDFEIMPTPKKRAISPLWLAGLCLWGVLIYSNTIHVPFVYDDERFIVKNQFIHTLPDSDLWETYKRRYIPFLSFALNYRVHGLAVEGYHWINLGIHILNTYLVVWLLYLLLGTEKNRKQPIFKKRHWIALFGGWLFVSHPVQTQAVTYITQRCESMATLFYLLAVCCYIKARSMAKNPTQHRVYFFISGLSALLGIFSKETVFTLPVMIVLLEWLFLKQRDGQALKTAGLYIGSLIMLCALAGVLFSFNLAVLSQFTHIGISAGRYFFTQMEVIPRYVGLLFLPLKQNLDYNVPLISFPPSLSVWAGSVIILSVLGLAIRVCRRHALIGFGMLWFFVTLSVTSSIVPLPDAMVEHRLYLPSVGFVTAVCTALFTWTREKYLRAVALALAGVILVFSSFTFNRNALWNDEVALWKDVAVKSPPSSRIYNNLGETYRNRGSYEKAIESYQKALQHPPLTHHVAAQIYVNMGAAYGELGNHRMEIECCLRAITLLPNEAWVYSHMSYTFKGLNDFNNALLYALKAIEIDPGFVGGINNVGVAYAGMGQFDKAIEYFELALEHDANYAQARKNLAAARDLLSQQTT